METTNNKYYFHPNNDCILHDFGIDIENRRSVKAWNTRKPMEIIVERLEEQAAFENVWDDETSCGAYNAYSHAIKIVQEEGD